MAKIVDKLENINNTLEKILETMNKPVHPFLKFLGIAGMIASIFVIIDAIDTILQWFKEGI